MGDSCVISAMVDGKYSPCLGWCVAVVWCKRCGEWAWAHEPDSWQSPPPQRAASRRSTHWTIQEGGGIGGGDGGPGPCGADEIPERSRRDQSPPGQSRPEPTRADETHGRDWDLEETETQEAERAHIVSRTEAGSLGGHGRSGASGSHDGSGDSMGHCGSGVSVSNGR